MTSSHRAQLNFTTFAAIANAAMGRTLDPPYDPFANDMAALIAAYILEDVGVTAYKARSDAAFNLNWSALVSSAGSGLGFVSVAFEMISFKDRAGLG